MGEPHKLIVFIGFIFLQFKMATTECATPDWFGPACDKKCHCSRRTCHVNGSCLQGDRCRMPHFGYLCQYVDISPRKIAVPPLHRLLDHNDSTCNTDGNLKEINITLQEEQFFTFVTLVFAERRPPDFLYSTGKNPRNIDTMLIFEGSKDPNCTSQTNWEINARTMDIKCDNKPLFKSLILRGPTVRYLCSVFISGGRNYGLRSFVKPMDSKYAAFKSDYAVDGEKNPPGCFVSNVLERDQAFEISLKTPIQMSRLVLTGLPEGSAPEDRIHTFNIYIYDANDKVLPKIRVDMQNLTWEITLDPNQTTRRLRFVPWGNKSQFSICEIEMFGDCTRSEFQYGLDCSESCNNCPQSTCVMSGTCYQCFAENATKFCWEACNTCEGRRACEMSTGVCNTGCKMGYRGDQCYERCVKCHENGTCDRYTGLCKEACAPSWMGKSCSERCINCAGDGSCNRITGECTIGCVKGFRGDVCLLKCSNCAGDGSCERMTGTCEAGCRPGFTGADCTSRCAKCASDGSCDQITKQCKHGCLAGYKGKTCDRNCSNCLVQCATETGMCLYGCKQGFSGDDCERSCTYCLGNRTCQQIDGACLYGCVTGHKGRDCNGVCRKCGGNGGCDRYTGVCSYGCIEGFKGDLCDETVEEQSTHLTELSILYGSIGIVLGVGMFCIVCYPRMCVDDEDPTLQLLDMRTVSTTISSVGSGPKRSGRLDSQISNMDGSLPSLGSDDSLDPKPTLLDESDSFGAIMHVQTANEVVL